MSNLNVHQLKVFLTAAETLNFTQAAQLLDTTQPSVSQHVQSLEEHFGLPLFVRSSRSVELTDSGMALVPLAREVVYLCAHIEDTMGAMKGEVHGHLIVGCSTSTGRYILPKILTDFHRGYPQVKATCLVTDQGCALQMLLDGKMHLALASNPPFCQDIEFRKVTSEQVRLVVPPDHPWAKREEIESHELLQGEFILPEEGSEIHATVRESLAALEISVYQLNTLVFLGSLEAIAFSVQEGLGVGFVPELIVDRLVKDRVVPVNVKGLAVRRDVYMGFNTRRQPTPAQKAFWEWIFN